MSLVWLDGRLVDKTDATVSVFDHGLLYGDGAWEGMRAYGGVVFRLAEHLDNLARSAAAIDLRLPLGPAAIGAAVTETLRANSRSDGYVRVIVTRGAGTLGLDPRKCEPAVIVLAEEVGLYPRELAEHGIDVVTVTAPRPHPPALLLSRSSFVAAKSAALRAGCFEALMFDLAGELIGSTEAEVFLISGGAVTTSPAGTGGPDPVMRAVVLDLAAAEGLPTAEWTLTRANVASADEVFLVGAAGGLIAVARIDGQPVGAGREGPVTRRLRELLARATRLTE
jgi:branched-chain amino acid aminotransferase